MADNSLPQIKTCSKCGETKPLEVFSRDKSKKSGFKSCCLVCDKAANRKWRDSRPDYAADYRSRKPEILRKAVAKWRANNPDKVREKEKTRPPRDKEKSREYAQKYYEQNKEALRKANRERYLENAEKNRAYRVEYYRANPEAVKRWREANPDKVRAYDRKKRSTPKGRLDQAVSVAIRESLTKGSKGGRSWEALVGYTIDDLMLHLEGLFHDGMSFENYGSWHIDHIIPKSVFNYEIPDHIDFKRCWALSNLQPLWALDNIVKNAKLYEPFQPSLAL